MLFLITLVIRAQVFQPHPASPSSRAGGRGTQPGRLAAGCRLLGCEPLGSHRPCACLSVCWPCPVIDCWCPSHYLCSVCTEARARGLPALHYLH